MEPMHVNTALRIEERLKKATAILEREHTPEEFAEAMRELKSLAEEMKVEYSEKPISKEAWESVWAGVIGDFINAFESTVVNGEPEEEDIDIYEAFLKGVARGMWAIYNMVEQLMVREK